MKKSTNAKDLDLWQRQVYSLVSDLIGFYLKAFKFERVCSSCEQVFKLSKMIQLNKLNIYK